MFVILSLFFGKYKTIEEAEKAVKTKTDIFTLTGKKMTLGQYYLNELLPVPLQDYSRELSSKTVKGLLETLYTKYPEDFQKVVDRWKELGRNYAVERGSTVSITD